MSSEQLPATTSSSLPAAALAGTSTWSTATAAYLAAGVDSRETERAYRRHLAAFAAAQHQLELEDGGERRAITLAPIRTLGDVTPAHMLAWRSQLTSSSSLSPASQAQALAALRGFLRWAGALGLHSVPGDAWREALRTPRAEVRRPYAVLTEGEILELLRAAATQRDRAILAVMLGGGLRAGEVAALEVGDLHQLEQGMALHIRQGKGRKDRTVPLGADTARLILEHLHAGGRKLGEGGALFMREDRADTGAARAITSRAVGMVVTRTARAAGIVGKDCSPHTLRHTYALRALRAGASVPAVSKLLGHASIATTQRYLDHLELDELRDAVPALPELEPAAA